MKKILLQMLTLVPLLIGSPLNALAVTAAVTVTATSSGSITSTQIATNSNAGGTIGYCAGAGTCNTTTPANSFCFGDVWGGNRGMPTTWNLGTFSVSAGTNTYNLNISPSSDPASLDQMLCYSSNTIQPGCQACICIGGATTSTSNGNCTVSGGEIFSTCDAFGHVLSVTSNLTLTCP